MRIEFPNDRDPELEAADLLRAMVRRDDAATVFGAERHFRHEAEGYAAARKCLEAWLTAPGRALDEVMTTSLHALRKPDAKGPSVVPDRTVGDILLPATLEDVLRRMGIDPRAYAVAMAFCDAEGEMSVDGVGILPCSVMSFHDGSYEIQARVQLSARNPSGWSDEIDTETDSIHLASLADLPETVRQMAPGRRLAEIVSHRLLDGIDLTVKCLRDLPRGVALVHQERKPRRIGDMAPLGGD